MKLATTTADFRDYCGTNNYEMIRHLYDAGFRHIDLSMSRPLEDDALLIRDDWKDEAKRLKEYANRLGMDFVQAHAPCNSNPFTSEEHYKAYLKWNIRSVEVCAELGIPNIVVHPCLTGLTPYLTRDEYFEKNVKMYKEFIPVMEKTGVNVLTENGNRSKTDDKFQLSTGAEMKELIEYVDHPLFHGCWDIAHRSMDGGTQYDDLVAIGKDLYALHVSDNRGPGMGHEHLLPYCGTVNFDDIMNGLLDIGYKGCFTFEACYTLRPVNAFYGPRNRFERDTRLLAQPLEIEKEMERLKYKVGKYILESYNCFEE